MVGESIDDAVDNAIDDDIGDAVGDDIGDGIGDREIAPLGFRTFVSDAFKTIFRMLLRQFSDHISLVV